ncbi:MAG: type III-A CRISPR-associated RAMP protein Csm3 [Anaerolineae bacterium]
MTEKKVELYGRIFVRGQIKVITGLHIGGSPTGLAIGALDNPIIRDVLTGRPYIPGSSVRGKMRSLWEKMTGAKQNWPIGKDVRIHICEQLADYNNCPVCQIYGIPGQLEASYPTRLVVRDAFLSAESEEKLRLEAKTDLPYTEIKWEAAIDRVTSAAVPRQMERVPAGAIFDGLEMVFSVYEPGDLERFLNLFEAMQLLQDDYLGGQGSRGSGKIEFIKLQVSCRSHDDYGVEKFWPDMPTAEGKSLVAQVLEPEKRKALLTWLKENITFQTTH